MDNLQLKWWQSPITLLVAQLLVLVAQPLLLSLGSTSLLSVIFGLILMYASIGNWSKQLRLYKIIACVACLILGLLYYIFISVVALKIAYIEICIVILTLALFAQIKMILKQKNITQNSLISCINSYILAAYLGASISWLIEVIQPGSFYIDHPVITHQLHDFIYFSFVTLATLGYGDITPVSEVAKMAVIFISLFGQLYVTIFISIILGKYLQQKQPAT